jgi:hypothetical protein
MITVVAAAIKSNGSRPSDRGRMVDANPTPVGFR